MNEGHVRDNFARLTLTIDGHDGPMAIEFVIDTAFDGDLALPSDITRRLVIAKAFTRTVRMADGRTSIRQYYRIVLEWNGEERMTDVLELDNAPLLGVELLAGNYIEIEMISGGRVVIEPIDD